MTSATRLLLWSARRSWPGVTASAVCGLGYQAGLILLPWCLQHAIDDGVKPQDQSAVLRWALVGLAVSLLLVVAETGLRWWAALAANATGNRLVGRLLDTVLGLDRAAAGRYPVGDLVDRGTRDVATVAEFLRVIPSLVSGVIGFCVVVVVIGSLDPMLAVTGLATLPLLVAVNLWYPRRFARANEEVSAAHGARATAVEDLLSASVAVRGIGGEGVLIARHHERSADLTARTLTLSRVAAGWSAHAPFVPWLATGVGVAVGGLAVLDGRFSIGGLVAFASWMMLLARQVMVLTDRFRQVGQAYTSAGRIAEVLDTVPTLSTPADPVALPRTGDLVLTGLGVTLPDRAPLTWPDLTIAAGEFVAVTGSVGSGKSTLLRLLARLQDPTVGTVTYGGVDLRTADLDDLRSRITLVAQRPALLSGTIAENLRLGRDALTDEDLLAACGTASVDGHVTGLPDGLDTDVGERGSALSGGQLQRLALARGLLRGASVLLLDDVTAAVDAGTEERIAARLRALAPAATIIAVTSRPALAGHADRVVDLGAGAMASAAPTGGSRG